MTDRIEKSFVVNAPVAKVWEAVSDYRQFGTWFRVALDQPFAVGGESTGHMTYEGYETYKWRAVVDAVEPERRLAFRWVHSDDPEHPREGDPMTAVEILLEPVAGGTQVTFIESGFDALPAPKRAEVVRSNTEGWEIQSANLTAHVAG